MKKIKLISLVMLVSLAGQAQTLNWRSFGAQEKYVVNIYAGWDYSASAGAAFGYKFKTKLPLLASVSASVPFGTTVTDDWKTKLGGQAEVFRSGGLSVTVKAFGVIRQYQSSPVQLVNFGSEFAGVVGFYKKRWFVAGEFGFDKAIATHIKHSDEMLQQYPAAMSGWYLPTGGNFFYGIQTGASFGKTDAYLQLGKTISQDLTTSSQLPLYLQFGVNLKLR